MKKAVLVIVVLMVFAGCATTSGPSSETPTPEEIAAQVKVATSKYRLENGLQVVVHEDHSDPIVAVAIMYHVGSSRERVGKTGFAHLFEHVMFQESENVPQDSFFRKIQNAGGTLNGFTWQDGTMYYEVVPKNALEMVLWMESDRMGFLLGALTDEAFHNQQLVVMNEKRQHIDNRPYGWVDYVMDSHLYGGGHPYGWQVIGSMTDVASASLDDVKSFFRSWYVPNNATLIIAGDIDPAGAKKLVEKYFGEIPRGGAIPVPEAPTVELAESHNIYYEDKFAQVPELVISWIGTPFFHDDEPAVDLLADVLSDGKSAPLFVKLVKEKKLTSRVSAAHGSKELAGDFTIRLRPDRGVTLDQLLQGVDEVLEEFASSNVTERRLQRIKAQFETGFYRRMESVFLKSMYLAMYNSFQGDPDMAGRDLLRYLEVTPGQIESVFSKYIHKQPRVILSVVPAGGKFVPVAGAVKAVLQDDGQVAPPEVTGAGGGRSRTPSAFDRSVEPAKGAFPRVLVPTPLQYEYKSGMTYVCVEQSELPIVEFALEFAGGHRADPAGKAGLANIVAGMLDEGTTRLTPAQLEEEFELLGSSVRVIPGPESIQIRGSTLARNLGATVALVEEMILEPRFDVTEFERIKRWAISTVEQNSGAPGWVADTVFMRLLWTGHVFGEPAEGTIESINKISLEDVKEFHRGALRPELTFAAVAGALDCSRTIDLFAPLSKSWKAAGKAPRQTVPGFNSKNMGKVFAVDIPGAEQSEIRIGGPFPARKMSDYYPAVVANYPIGGNFDSRFNMILREEKGFTYGAKSRVDAGRDIGMFRAYSSVQTIGSGESMSVFKEQLANASAGLKEEELAGTRQSLLNSMAREFETLSSLLGMIRNIGFYGLSADYVETNQEVVRTMTAARSGELVSRYFSPGKLVYLIVGDLEQVLPQFEQFGFTEITRLGLDGQHAD